MWKELALRARLRHVPRGVRKRPLSGGEMRSVTVLIPAYNERDTIAAAIREVPRMLRGIDAVHVVVVDDGSIDHTDCLARDAGCDDVLRLAHVGLGAAHKTALSYVLAKFDPDIIVNFDADLQYIGEEIPKLIEPILADGADVVIGDRRVHRIEGYPKYKVFTQHFWNLCVSAFLRQ